jgi:hypothetical protein
MVNHISACLWITIASLENDGDSVRFSNTWAKGYASSTSSQLYMVSFYWATTTITTVGYGDISGTTDIERIFCTIIMLFGVIAFSFANGSLTSIIQNIDSNNALFEQEINMLNEIYKDYCLPLELYNRLKKSIGYQHKEDIAGLQKFINNLPQKLKIEVSLYIYESRYTKIKFFKNQTPSFITWICSILIGQQVSENQYIFLEGDEGEDIYFMIAGRAAFVLPSYQNCKYIDIEVGDHFGITDIIGSSQKQNFPIESWINFKSSIHRQFCLRAVSQCEFLKLNYQYLYLMREEFPDCYNTLFESGIRRLRKQWILKLQAMQKCSE